MGRKRIVSNLHQLTVREILAAGDGDLSDGGGLILRIRGESASWVLRYTATTSRRREMGLGVARRGSAAQAGDSVTTARDLARDARDLLARDVDPIDERDGRKAAARANEAQQKADAKRERTTLARAARDYHERVIESSRSVKHAAQWIAHDNNFTLMPPDAIAGVWNQGSIGGSITALSSCHRNVRPCGVSSSTQLSS